MKITAKDLANITGGVLYGKEDLVIEELLTDSRQFSFAEGIVFFAIKGQNHNGSRFINQLYEKGVRIFVTDSADDMQEIDNREGAFIVVRDVIAAMQALSAYKRTCYKGTVIGITGSTGKTIVKEWLSDILGNKMSVVRSPKSFNSQVGVPLAIWKLENKYDTGVFEAGISMPGEMERLTGIIDPGIGVITNIGDAHQENFPDLSSKAAEKLKLFKNSHTIVYCRDHSLINDIIIHDPVLKDKRLISWSYQDKKASLLVHKKLSEPARTIINVFHSGRKSCFEIPFGDKASVENVITVIAVCMAMGIDYEIIRTGISSLESVAMRMEIKNGINGCVLIEDYYNSDPGSLRMAIEYLKSQNKKRSVLVLSDFMQSGRNDEELYGDVGDLVKKMDVSRFIGIGRSISSKQDSFPSGSRFYYTTDEFIKNFQATDFRDEIILLKGARTFEFEKIAALLELQVHQTVLEVNLDAISHNLNQFRRILNPGTRIMAMVKAFAYGAGYNEIAGLLEYHGIDYLAVAYTDEGVDLRLAGVSSPVVVMNPEPSAYNSLIKYNLEPEIYSINVLKGFTSALSRHGITGYPVHIKVDSGMHRLGFMLRDLDELLTFLQLNDRIRIVSVFSHLSASEDEQFDSFTHKQLGVFQECTEKIAGVVGYRFLRHILNSAGIARFPQYQFDMVRPGIGLYGAGTYPGLDLKTAGTFKTRISQIKRVPGGEPVGYGCADADPGERSIAILPVGYADGLSRRMGNRNGKVFVKGHAVPVIGNICMDLCMADITGTGASEGDEAEIFGNNISVEQVAQWCDTIPYEILTSIPQRVKRVFIRE